MRAYLFLVLALVGCSTTPKTPDAATPAPAATPASKVKVDDAQPVAEAPPAEPVRAPTRAMVLAKLSRDPCFGRCPVYEAVLFADGTLSFDGKHSTEVKGAKGATLTADQVAALRKRVESSDFAKWKTAYVNRRVTDMATVTITYENKTIRHYLGDDSAPPDLVQLEKDMEELMGLNEMIHGASK